MDLKGKVALITGTKIQGKNHWYYSTPGGIGTFSISGNAPRFAL